MCSQLPRYEDVVPPSYETLQHLPCAVDAESTRRGICLPLTFRRPSVVNCSGDSVRPRRIGPIGRRGRSFSPVAVTSPIISSPVLSPYTSPTSNPLSLRYQTSSRHFNMRRQNSSNYFNNMFVLNNYEASPNLPAYVPRSLVSADEQREETKWLEEKMSTLEDAEEGISAFETGSKKCRNSAHLITFLWSDVEHAKCIGTTLYTNYSCYTKIPMKFWTSFGFSVCRATFCTTRSIFLSGGHGPASKNMHQLDMYRNKWIECHPMLTSRRNHAMVSNGHKIYVIGGVDENKKPLQSIEAYNMKTNRWKDVERLKSPVSLPTVVRSLDCIYVLGGKDEHGASTDIIQMFDTSTNSCRILETRLCRKISDAKGILRGEHIFIAGNHGLFLKFNPASKNSTRLNSHGLNRIHKITFHSSGDIVVVGQKATDSLLVKQFDFRGQSWNTVKEFICRGHIEGVLTLPHCPL